MSTGIRVSFDYNIRSSLVALELGHAERELILRGGVIEVKGPTLELPITLRNIRLLDIELPGLINHKILSEACFEN